MKAHQLFIICLFLIAVLPVSNCFAAASLSLEAGTSAGWDYQDLNTDIAKNNTVDWDDLGVIAAHWLASDCSIANEWCASADLDDSTGVDLLDYSILTNDWGKQGAQNVLLQTIYGTLQDANGTITANTGHALSLDKGCAMVFAVPQDTALDKGWFKLLAIKASYSLQVRLFNVTGRGYLTSGPISKADPSGSGSDPLFDKTVATGSSVPSHLELGVKVTDLIVDFGPLEVTAGEYLITFDNLGPDNTIGSITRGIGVAIADPMGTYPDGTPLPKRAIVTGSTAGTANTYFYYLSANTATSYKAANNLLAFQITKTTVNHKPVVDAGTNQTIINPTNSVSLDGTVSDDGLPNPPGVLTTTWSKDSGPGDVTFGDASAVDTTATFSAYGEYVLRLTANDGDLSGSDVVTITYLEAEPGNQAPVVDAGSNQTITLPDSATLNGTVTDDGLPLPSNLTTLWTKTSGPGTVTFGDASAVDTTASFSAGGTYVLRLTADDGDLQSYDEVTISAQTFGSYEGYGAGATGGAGGTVIWVNNLNASGAGSLQAALSAAGPSIIKFSVGGRIVVSSTLSLSHGDVTIMGSTAPAPGITIDGDNVSYRALEVDGSNIIIENMRFRNTGGELVLVWGGSNIVFDHCSFTWNGDGALDINGGDWGVGVNHVTINRCLFGGSEELSRSHGHQITWMYNLMTTCNRRQPKIALGGPDYNLQCNYIRNWCNTATHIEAGNGGINIINNYYGPPYPTENWNVACYNSTVDPNFIYTAGNAHAPDVPTSPPRGDYSANNVGAALVPQVVEAPPVPVTLIDANNVPASVLASVGALPSDSHDLAYITGSYTGRDHTIGGEGP